MSHTFTLTFMLYTNDYVYSKLEKCFNVAHHFYNACLGECKRRKKKWQNHPDYIEAVKLYKEKKTKDINKKQYELFERARTETGYYLRSNSFGREDSLCRWSSKTRKVFICEHLPAHCCEAIMKKAFLASKNQTSYFKKFGLDFIYSVQGHSKNDTPRLVKEQIRRFNKFTDCFKKFKIDSEHPVVHWKEIIIPIIVKKDDQRLKELVDNKYRILFCRIYRKEVKGKWRYFVKVICEGNLVPKHNKLLGEGVIGIDIGVSSIAYVSDTKAGLLPLAQNSQELINKTKLLDRKLDRQRRSNNPNKFNFDNTFKNGNKEPWISSKRQEKTRAKLANCRRQLAEARKCEQGRITNQIRSLGNILNIEVESINGWRKGFFGRQVSNNCPAQMQELLINKFNLTDGEINHPVSNKNKSSQTCPNCGNVKKSELGDRIYKCDKCMFMMQRDLASAIINYAYDPETKTFNVNIAKNYIKGKKTVLKTALEEVVEFTKSGCQIPDSFGTLSELQQVIDSLQELE